jgi:hypothetical protein
MRAAFIVLDRIGAGVGSGDVAADDTLMLEAGG